MQAKDNVYDIVGTERADQTPGFVKRAWAAEGGRPYDGCGASAVRTVGAGALARPHTPDAWAYGTRDSVTLANNYVTLVFDGKGCISSLKEKASGRELVVTRKPFVTLTLKNGAEIEPEKMVGDTIPPSINGGAHDRKGSRTSGT